MQNSKRDLFTAIIAIISILTLSLKDTLTFVHTFLHKIPNTFHAHSSDKHSHSVFHFEDFEEEHHYHVHEKGEHHHHEEDALLPVKNENSENPPVKNNIKPLVKIDLFYEREGKKQFILYFQSIDRKLFFNSNRINYILVAPPNPPPEFYKT